LAGSFEPTPEQVGGKAIGLSIPYSAYPWVYAVKIALTVGAIAFVWPDYFELPRRRFGKLAVLVGILGGPLWIGICHLDIEHRFLQPLLEQISMGGFIGAGDRPAFNPFEQIAGPPAAAWAFLAVRFFGLVLIVPLIEEFFLRGFVMRFFMDRSWWSIPFGEPDRFAIFLGTAVPMMMHPGELIAAMVWFSMVTWLMIRTRSIWDCVVAHALTNLILGIYVVTTNSWRLM
jgi:uncharacterized protein